MKKTIELLNKVVELGFNKEEALTAIDASLDDVLGFENRKDINKEEIENSLYNEILYGFMIDVDANVDALESYQNIDKKMYEKGYYSRYDEITKEEIESGEIYYTSRFTNEVGAKVEFTDADITDFANDSLLYNVSIYIEDEPELVRHGEEINVDEYLQEVITAYMKDDIRESVHNEYAPCTFNKFLKEYCNRDFEFEDLLYSEFSIIIF